MLSIFLSFFIIFHNILQFCSQKGASLWFWKRKQAIKKQIIETSEKLKNVCLSDSLDQVH